MNTKERLNFSEMNQNAIEMMAGVRVYKAFINYEKKSKFRKKRNGSLH